MKKAGYRQYTEWAPGSFQRLKDQTQEASASIGCLPVHCPADTSVIWLSSYLSICKD